MREHFNVCFGLLLVGKRAEMILKLFCFLIVGKVAGGILKRNTAENVDAFIFKLSLDDLGILRRSSP